MVTPRLPNDKITIAPDVLLTVVRLATLQTDGVARMGNTPGKFNRWNRRTPNETGVQLLVDEQTHEVIVDLYIVVYAEADLLNVSHHIQTRVARELQDNVGMPVNTVNIYIEDVEFS